MHSRHACRPRPTAAPLRLRAFLHPQPSVHVYNASLAACERVGRVETALELLQSMHREGVEPNLVTHQLMAVVGRQGVQSVEQQQVAAATLSAICAAAGSLLIKVGMF